jgi:uncharacterized protein DUF3443
MIKGLALAAIVTTLGCGSSSNGVDGGTSLATVPIVVHDKFTAGLAGMLIPVRVGPSGSATAQVILDTGSSGLRILASALASDTYQRTGTKVTNTFDNGMVFDGELATAIVAVGDAATPQAIEIEVVDSVSCAASEPNCVAAAGASALTDVGTMGAFGVGLRGYDGTTLFSPIAQLPTAIQSYSIHLDSGGTSGSLAIGLAASELSTYDLVSLSPDTSQHPNGVPAWNDLAVPVCFAVAATPVSQPCSAETAFDSGTTEVVLLDGDIPATEEDSAGYLTSGTAFEASLSGAFDWSTAATTGEIYVASSSAGSFDRILGMPFFAAHDVAFDIQAGQIGIREAAAQP